MKTALVTGAGSGIGRAVAKALSDDGYALILAGRRQEMLEETAAMLAGESLVQVANVTAPESVAALFAAVKAQFGRLDLLFNNAGTGLKGTILFEDIEIADWQHTVNVNLNGYFYCMQQAFLLMKDQDPQGGRIINNGSISAHMPRPNSAPYTATKHAISGLTRSGSLDGRKYNIAVGQIDIGNAQTDMTKPMQAGLLQASGDTRVEPVMDVGNVATSVVHMAGLPLNANVQFMTVMATGMPYIGRG